MAIVAMPARASAGASKSGTCSLKGRNRVVRCSNERRVGIGFGESIRKAVAGAAVVIGMGLGVTGEAHAGPMLLRESVASSLVRHAPLGKLTAANPISSPRSLLRYALPVRESNIRQIQDALESIREDLRVPGVRFSGVSKSVNRSLGVLSGNGKQILGQMADKQRGQELLNDLKQDLKEFQVIVENQDRQAVPVQQQKCLDTVGSIEELMVTKFPFEIPKEFASRPVLMGRATVEVKVKYAGHVPIDTNNDTMEMVIDGFNAPVTGGNFLDLVQRKFYDGMKVQRSDGFVIQTGDPEGKADGFVDPGTEKVRTIPFEVMFRGDKMPEYEFTLEDLGRATDEVTLPFNAFGTLAMARLESDANSASSQIFWLLKDSDVTPSNTNILDGNYAVFGYVTKGSDLLRELQVGDVIEYAKVTSGLENLQNPSYKLSSLISSSTDDTTSSDAPASTE